MFKLFLLGLTPLHFIWIVFLTIFLYAVVSEAAPVLMAWTDWKVGPSVADRFADTWVFTTVHSN